MQKATEVCRLSSALPSARTASLLSGATSRAQLGEETSKRGAKIRGICTELATAAGPFPGRVESRLSLSSPHLP